MRFFTRAGAAAAARDLNAVNAVRRPGLLDAVQGVTTPSRWTPIRGRVLRSIQSHNLTEERRLLLKTEFMSSLARHPAGKKLIHPEQEKAVADAQSES